MLKLSQNSFKALYSSFSQLSFVKNSSKIKIDFSSITLFEQFNAHKVDEYKSASKFISDARGLFWEKNFGKVFSNLPTINSPPLILGIYPKLE